MKLKLEHLAPYLPYGLNLFIIDEKLVSKLELLGDYVRLDVESDFDFHEVKPILRPLSDLNKIINHNGEELILANYIMHETKKIGLYKSQYADGYNSYKYNIIQKPFGKILKITNHDDWVCLVSISDMNRNKKYVIDLMLKYHFDVFDLHSKKLCVYYSELDK